MSMWGTVASDPAETTAFFSLLDEYFASRGTLSPSPAHRAPSTSHPTPRALAPASHSGLPTPMAPPPSFSSRAESLSHSAGPSIANAALKNTAVTGAAFREAGLSPAAASAASNFSAKHSTTLAPHVANAASSGWANRGAVAGAATGAPERPTMPRASGSGGGVRKQQFVPSGLSTKSTSFASTVWNSKGPMSSEEAKKNVFKESLATKAPPKARTPPVTSHSPPPLHGAPEGGAMGRAEAIYDYAGTEPDDLGVKEGEVVAVLEHVSEDWWKCRGSQGEGLVPASYLKVV